MYFCNTLYIFCLRCGPTRSYNDTDLILDLLVVEGLEPKHWMTDADINTALWGPTVICQSHVDSQCYLLIFSLWVVVPVYVLSRGSSKSVQDGYFTLLGFLVVYLWFMNDFHRLTNSSSLLYHRTSENRWSQKLTDIVRPSDHFYLRSPSFSLIGSSMLLTKRFSMCHKSIEEQHDGRHKKDSVHVPVEQS
jgi:hypothetical protein